MHIHIHIHAHAYTHTYIHICTQIQHVATRFFPKHLDMVSVVCETEEKGTSGVTSQGYATD